MAVTILTKEDLQEFKDELINEIKELLEIRNAKRRKWMKSTDVQEWLNVSASTLQTLRINGTVKYSRIGGMLFYDYEHINSLLEGTSPPSPLLKARGGTV